MDAASPALASLKSRAIRGETVRAAILASVGGLAALGLFLVSRRATGALSAYLPAGPLLSTAAIAAAIIFCGRIIWRRSLPSDPTSKQAAQSRLVAWTGTLALWLLAAGCALPAPRTLDWLAWLPVLIADQVLRQRLIEQVAVKSPQPRHGPTLQAPAVIPLHLHGEGDAAAQQVLDDAVDEEEDLLQRLVRRRNAEGVERIEGSLRAEFSAGQRTAVLHVGFCPPLEILPEVEAEIADGPDAMVKVVQAFCHGARLEVRLAEPAEEACGVVVEFVAAPSAPLARRG